LLCIKLQENITYQQHTNPVAPHCSTQDPGGGVGSRSEGWSWVGLGVGLGIRGWSWIGLGQGCPFLLLPTDCPAQFISNPNQTHLKKPAIVFRITWKLKAGVFDCLMMFSTPGLGICKAGVSRVSRSDFSMWISCSAVRTISWRPTLN